MAKTYTVYMALSEVGIEPTISGFGNQRLATRPQARTPYN